MFAVKDEIYRLSHSTMLKWFPIRLIELRKKDDELEKRIAALEKKAE